jgi:DNA mismatch repair protein MutS
LIDDLPLFQVAVRREEASRGPSKVEETLKAMSLDDMTPREALDALYDLKKKMK